MWTLNLSNLRENVKLDLCSNLTCVETGVPHAQVPSPITTNQCHFNHTAAQRCIVKCGCCYPFFPLQWLVFLLRIKFTSVQWQKVLYLSKYLTLGFKVQQILQKIHIRERISFSSWISTLIMLFCPRNLEQRKLTELSILAIKQMVLGAFLCTTIQEATSARCYFPGLFIDWTKSRKGLKIEIRFPFLQCVEIKQPLATHNIIIISIIIFIIIVPCSIPSSHGPIRIEPSLRHAPV